jgi:choline dehydrogenase
MIYQRGNPKDYDQLAELTGDPEWKYKNVLQFFKKSEDYHGNYANGLSKVSVILGK